MRKFVHSVCSLCLLSRDENIIGQVVEAKPAVEQVVPPVVLFVGEAPGPAEVSVGEPFVGESGRLLRKLLEEYNLLQHAILTNAVLCAPQGEIRNNEKWWDVNAIKCHHILREYIRKNPPRVIVALGRAALAHILGKNKNVALHKRVEVEFIVEEGGRTVLRNIPVYFTYNPAFLLRHPDVKHINQFRNMLARIRAELLGEKENTVRIEDLGNIPVIREHHNRELESFLRLLELEYANEKVIPVVIDIEVGAPHAGSSFDGKHPDAKIVLIGVGDGHGRLYRPFLLYDPAAGASTINPQEWTAFIHLLQSNKYLKIMHNASFEIMWFLRYWKVFPQPNRFVDTMLFAHALDENKSSYSLEALATVYLPDNPFVGWKQWAHEFSESLNACEIPLEKLVAYNRVDVYITAALYQALVKELNSLPPRLSHMLKTFMAQIANPIAIVVGHISACGIPASLQKREEIVRQLKDMETELLAKLHEKAPQVRNFNSTQQLAQYLLSIGVEELKEFRTEKGNYSLKSEVIDKLCEMRPDVEFLQLLKEYREVTKCESTFLRKIPQWVHEPTGRIYPNMHPTGTVTGRLTTSNPPLQNFPSEKKAIGKIIRKVFTAPQGFVFVTCDAKQHELRILAIKSGDANLREAFLSGYDVHQANAARILNKPIEEITEEERQIGKRFSFAAVYGASAAGISEIFNVPLEEGEKLLEQMRKAFQQAMDYLESVKKRVFQYPGLVFTRLGRCRRLLHDVGRKKLDSSVLERVRRRAGNFVIQADASDIWCAVAYHVFLDFYKRGWANWGEDGSPPAANLSLLIHDSMVITCKEELADDVVNIIKRALAIVSYRYDTVDLPFTGEWGVYRSLGDEPIKSGEFTVGEIQEEIERYLAAGEPVKPFRLFYEDYLDSIYQAENGEEA